MEFYTSDQDFIEELQGVRNMEYCTNQDFNTTNIGWSSDLDLFPANSCFQDYSLPIAPAPDCPLYSVPFGDELSAPDFTSDSSNARLNSQTLPYDNSQEEYYSIPILGDEDGGTAALSRTGVSDMGIGAPCKVEPVPELPTFNTGFSFETQVKNKGKKLNGQPSKNLMAERRRRKRLNDRLSMLRSVVPKISKMDRTSILGDTIDYMKELLERVNNLQEEMDLATKELGLFSMFKDVKPNEILVRNSPKFDVERRGSETKIQICCAGKPGLLLSTVTTLEASALEIQHCVISCFNDFAMQASCSEGRATWGLGEGRRQRLGEGETAVTVNEEAQGKEGREKGGLEKWGKWRRWGNMEGGGGWRWHGVRGGVGGGEGEGLAGVSRVKF
ncbi:UNVERIFIED_CONTAM: Transcription factor [Sesamum latifolium]|uniref:Transcription factor n=1 Tax=Sesamum latifolium TaxID=2727402 RepID=A0AAW2WDI4_9LAMI